MADRVGQPFDATVVAAVEQQQHVTHVGCVQRVLETPLACRRHAHAAHRRSPLVPGDHRAAMRAEADEHHVVRVVCLPNELADVRHPRARHVGEARIANVRVVLPHDRLRLGAVMLHEPLERLDHVRVAHVPRRGTATHHRAVVALRILGDERVLLGVEERVGAVLAELGGLGAKRGEHGHGFALTGRRDERRRAGVLLHIFAVRLEASIGRPRRTGERRVDRLEIPDDRVHRLP
jgi:hypothetical protein